MIHDGDLEMTGEEPQPTRGRVVLPLAGMHCAECALNIEKSIRHLPGVVEASVNYVTNRATVVFEGERISLEDIKRGFEKPGYRVRGEARVSVARLWEQKGRWLLMVMVGLGVTVSWVFRWMGMSEGAADLPALAGAGIGGLVILRRALRALWERSLNVDVLVAMAVGGAIVLREYTAGGAVVFIVLFGEWLEEFTLDKSRKAVRRLLEVLPEVALVRRDGREEQVKPGEVLLTDVAIVKPGGRIPVDGTVVAGSGSVNQAAVTGESALMEKHPGSTVFAGTLLDTGALEIQPSRVGGETTVARIRTLVDQANEEKAPIERVADRYAAWFIPAVLVVAGVAYLITGQALRAVTVLIVACPCGLILATPTAVFAAIGRAARNGILVRGGAYLEAAGRVKVVVFDKTGTLTYGEPRVLSVIPWNGRQETEVLSLAAAAERMSEHPLAAAILARAEEAGVRAPALDGVALLKGKGISGGAGEGRVLVGNRRLLEENGVAIPQEATGIAAQSEKEGRTVVFLGKNGRLAGMFVIGDELRPEAGAVVDQLRKMGITSVAMITGDSRATAEAVGRQAGIENVLAEVLPEEKMAVVRDIQRRGVAVAMAGDGINDAPALAAADLGIAMGVSGSDVAIETAPVALLEDQLLRIPEMLSLGRASLAIIGQNMLFSLAYNVLAVAFAVGGSLGPIWGAVVHEAGSVLVILNSMRLLRFRPDRSTQKRRKKHMNHRLHGLPQIFYLLVFSAALVFGLPGHASAQEYLWLEAERFEGVLGSNPSFLEMPLESQRGWGLNGPGVAHEWGQGGESEWNSIAAHKEEEAAECYLEVVVPRAGRYSVWVRYAEWQFAPTSFKVRIEQQGKVAFDHEYGKKPVLDPYDEALLYWGWSFVWDKGEAQLGKGPARVVLYTDRPSAARKHVDCLLLTNDRDFLPRGREKPPFAYFRHLDQQRSAGEALPLAPLLPRGDGFTVPPGWERPKFYGQDFWVPWNVNDYFWRQEGSLPESERMFYPFSVEEPGGTMDAFVQKYKGRRDVPIFSSPLVVPTFHINSLPAMLSDDSAFFKWAQETKKPFASCINYGYAQMDEKKGPEVHHNLKSILGDQFLGWISGENLGYSDYNPPTGITKEMSPKQALATIHERLDAALRQKYDGVFHTSAGPMWEDLIACLSQYSLIYSHALYEWGCRLVGMETTAVMPGFAMRIAFHRGAARQYGAGWFYYHAPNFGDTATYFTHSASRAGPDAWFHSRYGLVWGPSIGWYRRAYYLQYMSGASMIWLEQGFDQFFKPGPGEHPVQLNPLGKVTQEFLQFAEKHPDRGVAFTPVAFLLDQAHGWDNIMYSYGRPFDSEIPAGRGQLAIREMMNTAYYPLPVAEGEPCTADRQVYVPGIFGDIFDVIVTSPTRLEAVDNYRVVILTGEVELSAAWLGKLRSYVENGGTLVVNAANTYQGAALPPDLLGLKPSSTPTRESERAVCNLEPTWMESSPLEYVDAELGTAEVVAQAANGDPLLTINRVGKGRVLFCAIPYFLGEDERPVPLLGHLLGHLTAGLLPIEVRGEVEFLVNRNGRGWVVTMFNTRGVYKPQQGLGPIKREEVAHVTLTSREPVKASSEWISGQPLTWESQGGRNSLRMTIPAGGIAVIEIVTL